MNQSQRTLQEYHTTLSPVQVITQAKMFFTQRSSIYPAFPEREGPGYVTFRSQGGEELAIGAVERDGATLVTGSTYFFDMPIARFFTTLPPFILSEQLLPPGPAAEKTPDLAVRP
jgi:hypothetical protein